MKPRWRASANGKYWYVSARGKAMFSHEYGQLVDDTRYKAGNYYQTEALVEQSLAKGVTLQRALYL